MVSGASLATGGREAQPEATQGRTLFLFAWVALSLVKFGLAWNLDLFGDEAFYRLEALHPAMGYSDLPPLTAWLMAAARWAFGDHHAALRAPFLVLGAAVPWLVYAWARRRPETAAVAWHAAVLACALPLAGLLGVFALPDVPLTCAMLLAAIALDRALESDHRGAWTLLGIALAIGWLSHYRFVFWYAAGLGWFVFANRKVWRNPRFWLAQSIGVLGLLPTLLFNLQNRWSGFQFQFVDRHPWRWHADALMDPAWQSLLATPPLFIAMMFAMWSVCRSVRNGDRRALAAAWSTAGLLAIIWIVGMFADSLRSRFHWPLPAWLLILPWVAALLHRAESRPGVTRALARSVLPVAFAALTLAAVCLGLVAGGAERARFWRAPLPDNLLGWREVGAWAGALVPPGASGRVVADNVLLAAELSDQLRSDVASLDHPLNLKHGRRLQLALWGMDESALASWPRADTGLLVAEPGALAIVDWAAWQQRFCTLFDRVELRSELSLPATGDRWIAYAVTADAGPSGRLCSLAPIARLDSPGCGDEVVAGDTVDLGGWMFFTNDRVRRLRLAVGDGEFEDAVIGIARPDVQASFHQSKPAGTAPGFLARANIRALAPGIHRVRALVVTETGRTVAAEFPQRIRLAGSASAHAAGRGRSALDAWNSGCPAEGSQP